MNTAYLVQTSVILDTCVRRVDRIVDSGDLSLASVEMALGTPLATRAIDLGFGAAPTQAPVAPSKNLITLCRGVFRLGGSLSEYASSTPYAISFDVEDWLGSAPLQGVYAFARIVASSSSGLSIELRPLLGGASGTDTLRPIFMLRDFDKDTVEHMLTDGSVEFPDLDSTEIELVRLAASINYYLPGMSAVEALDASTIFADMRRPRGWGGFADELMGHWLQPAVARQPTAQGAYIQTVQASLYNLVKSWVALGWQPDFITFWRAYGLPTRLSSYLAEALGIVV